MVSSILQQEVLGVQEDSGIKPRSECPVDYQSRQLNGSSEVYPMKRHYSLSFVTGMLALVCYLAFAFLAFSRYPLTYSPLSNWLSDLGNANLNPNGAFFYNIGIVATAGAVLLFFLGLSEWKLRNNRGQNLMLFVTQGFGILGALAMLMSGFYPMNFLALHSFFSTCLYILLGTAFAFSVAALRYYATYPRWLLIVGASVALVALLYGIFHTVTVLEWVTTALFLCYMGLLGAETNRLSSETIDRSTTKVSR
jgi:hypothetical membrane protein